MAKYKRLILIALIALVAVLYGALMFSAGTRSGETTVFLEGKAAEACYLNTFWFFGWHIECKGSWQGSYCTLQYREAGTEMPWNSAFTSRAYNTFYEFRCLCE